jgi:16S rRNA (uracil1498-N3)-methyltransferase
MKFNRFFVELDLDQDNLQINDWETYNQIRNVLRLKPGEQIILFDGNSNEAQAEILDVDAKNKIINVIIVGRKKIDFEKNRETILYCSILKKENFELVVQKVTEIGISKIVPMICERTVKTGMKKDRFEKIIKEACEQSGRVMIPKIENAIDFNAAIELAKTNDVNLFFDISGEKIGPSTLPTGKQVLLGANKIGLFIGPEGGWNDEEIKLAQDNKFKITKLSNLIFRAETAAIIATYLASID